MNDEAAIEMPRYQCHKKVWALQIKEVTQGPGVDFPKVTLVFERKEYAPMELPIGFFFRYWPKIGDYFVVYDDGYKSISPKKAFEEGYTRIDGQE